MNFLAYRQWLTIEFVFHEIFDFTELLENYPEALINLSLISNLML